MSSFFAKSLLAWHDENPRPLPWADGLRDPYRIWLSEIIMQQTRVEQGTAYYLRFVHAYPDVGALAQASLDDVMRLWEGLGYYTRARNLHKTAYHIYHQLGGIFPQTYHGLLALPGIGPYSAAAISSFAYGLRHVVVDGNVKRVIARYDGIFESIDEPTTHELIRNAADTYMGRTPPDIFNQAIMNFGALVCKPSLPLCEICPLSTGCYAFQNDCVSVLPVRKKKNSVRERFFHFLLIRYRDMVLLHRRNQNDIWHSLYSLPFMERRSARSPGQKNLLSGASSFVGHSNLTLRGSQIEILQQTLSHQRIMGRFYIIDVARKPRPAPEDYYWVPIEDVSKYGKPKIISTFLSELNNE